MAGTIALRIRYFVITKDTYIQLLFTIELNQGKSGKDSQVFRHSVYWEIGANQEIISYPLFFLEFS